MHPSDIGDKIESFMRTAFRIAPDDPGFNRTIDLFEAGYVDSIGVMETLAFIANEFNIEVPESELLDDAFSNIDGMARIIARFTAQTPPKRQGYESHDPIPDNVWGGVLASSTQR